jgi:5-methylcytosine-specific restriction enzyme B
MAVDGQGAGLSSTGSLTTYDEHEWAFRKQRFEQLRAHAEGVDRVLEVSKTSRAVGRQALMPILDRFRDDRDPAAFKVDMDVWSREHRTFGFAAMNGAMFLNQLVNDSDPVVIADLLLTLIAAPADDAEAEQKFDLLLDHVEVLRREGSHAAAGRVPGFLSWFWWIEDPDRWPAMFSSGWAALEGMGFVDGSMNAWGRYADFRRHVRQFGTYDEVEVVFGEGDRGALGLDPSSIDRCRRIHQTAVRPEDDDGTYAINQASVAVLRASFQAMRGDLEAMAAEEFGVAVKASTPGIYWHSQAKRLREDMWLHLRPMVDCLTPFLMIIVDVQGVKVGLYASSLQGGGKGFEARVSELLDGRAPDGYEDLPWGITEPGPDYQGGVSKYALLGRHIPLDDVLDREQLVETVRTAARELKPCFDAVWAAEKPAPPPRPAATADQDLLALKSLFLDEVGYPRADDESRSGERAHFAELLAPAKLASLSQADFRRIAGGSGYGAPGPQSILFTELRDGDERTYDRVLVAVNYLLWDDVDDVETRINRVLDEDDLGVRGMKDSVIMKLLAIVDPDRFLPVFPLTGDKGKASLLAALDLDPPPFDASTGQRHVDANDRLRELTEPLLPGDAWGQMQFLYWVKERQDAPSGEAALDFEEQVDVIGEAATDLHLPRPFLDDLVTLLQDHRQLIFYGPPGTGKTFVARRIAAALAPDDRHQLIQFHPSTSYEDFFEGFRPQRAADGSISYSLMPGPLRLMAEQAAADPTNRPHILIIDEINRANLAKVLGELLFVLEYRDAEIRPLYQPDEPFTLPKNLWIIGTMNTADRSIATVDAALRRRFQFVPFVPDDREDNPISGLLSRWLPDDAQWVAELVDKVNQDLREKMGGDHLLLGPSYFMRAQMDEATLRRIWTYQIEPLVDDLLFGMTGAKDFRFDAVWRKYGPDDQTGA